MRTSLVTGGAGFIGSHLAEALLKRGDAVVVVDNLSSGKQENLDHLKSLGGRFRVLIGDVSDPGVARESVKGVNAVYHQAAQGSVPKSVEDPRSAHVANVNGTVEMLIAAKDAGIRRFVVAASSSAYGETPELPKRESIVPSPLSPYAVTKLAQEQYAQAFAASYGMETVSLRYFNVYGPKQDPSSQYAAVIPKFFDSFLKGEAPPVFGDGEQTRDFTYVGDVVAANLAAADMKGAAGQVFNIAGGKRISVNELARIIAKLVGSDLKPRYLPPRAGDIRDSLADISLARKHLGFEPRVELEEGLRRCYEWYRSR
jgi:nucleoside-diphosphate-sugar epimerase